MKAPPMFRPKGTEAGARATVKAVQGVQAMTDEQVREEFAQLRELGRGSGKAEPCHSSGSAGA